MNTLRVALVAGVSAASLLVFTNRSNPIHAAQQNAPVGTESSPPVRAGAHEDPGALSYAQHCAVCHGDEREGNLPGFPPLLGIRRQMSNDQIIALIHAGKGRMPSFPALQDGELNSLLHFLTSVEPASASGKPGQATRQESALVAAGDGLFHQNCAFCHGRDAMGGESGPDLTQSKIVLGDKNGEQIAAVVREGRPDNKMPAFNFSSQELLSLAAFIHERVKNAAEHPGGRRGVSVADLQTGNVDAGKAYFNGAGGCAKCHSPSGDLAGIATRYQGLQLEERMLFPRNARSTLTVELSSGEKLTGMLVYRDEFTIAMRDGSGVYRSWSTSKVKLTVHSPVEAHVEQFPKYTDDDVHNLMAYLQTLR